MVLATMMTECADEIDRLRADNNRLREAITQQNHEVCQTLGKALGYPWFKDDAENFPSATEADGVCVGDHVADTLACEAATRIDRLRAAVRAAHEVIKATGVDRDAVCDAWQSAYAAVKEGL